jgi:hypothetical protein
MADLIKHISVNDGSSHPLYTVMLHEDGYDGGNYPAFIVSTENSGSITSANVETAIQAFADSLSSTAGIALVSVKKITVSETTL